MKRRNPDRQPDPDLARRQAQRFPPITPKLIEELRANVPQYLRDAIDAEEKVAAYHRSIDALAADPQGLVDAYREQFGTDVVALEG